MKNNSILKNVIFKFSLEILRILIPIICIPYIYRIFKPEVMGQIEFSQSIVNYFFIFAGFGVYNYGLREISRVRNDKEKREKLFIDLFIISIISSTVVTLLYFLYIYFNFYSDVILKKMLIINSINLIAYIFYIEWINEAFENYKFISQKTIVIKIINLICIFLFVKNSHDFYKYLFLINIFIFLNNFISFVYIRNYINFSFKNIEIKKYLFALFLILLISNLNMLYTQLDKIILGFYGKDMEQIAYYGIAQKVVSILMVIPMSIITVIISRLSNYLGEGKKKEYEELLNNSLSFFYLILFPIAIGIGIMSEEICLILGGENYLSAKMVVILFGIRLIIVLTASVLINQVLFLNRKEKEVMKILAICGILNLSFKILITYMKILNENTAILTTTFSEIIMIILCYFFIKKYLKFNLIIFKFATLKYLIFSLSFIIIQYFSSLIQITIIERIILKLFICIIIYLSFLFITKDRNLNIIIKKITEKN